MESGEQQRLESWKEIAAYLQRDVRTARRWELEEGLPVHRHSHRRRASVYAYASELDEWREGRKPDPEPEPTPEPIALWGSPVSSLATAALLLGALLWVGNTASEVQAQGLSEAGVTARQFELSEAAEAASVRPGNVTADGRYLGATDYKTFNAAIVDVSTGDYRTISHYNTDGENDEFIDLAAISRDGGRIAYWYYRYGATFGSLRAIDADGTNELTLYEDACRETSCEWGEPRDWSPDGRWILMFLERGETLAEGTAQIMMVPSNGGEPRVLQSYEYIRRYRPNVQFSPDGKYVAYDYPPDASMAEGDLYVLPLDGGEPVVIAPHPARDVFLSWTPDGNLLFQSERGSGAGDVYQVRIEDGRQAGDPQLVRPDLKVQWPYGFAQNGAFFYAMQSPRTDAQLVRVDFAARKVLDPPVSISERFAGATAFPSFSPDGAKVAYLHITSPRNTIVIQDLASGVEREILTEIQFDARSRLRWHSDGEHLLGLTTQADQNGLYQIDVRTGDAQLIYARNDIPYFDSLDWSPDARYIFQPRPGGLGQYDVQTGTQVMLGASSFRGVTVSPDGQQLAFYHPMRDEDGNGADLVRVMQVDGSGGETTLYQSERALQPGVAWTADSQNVLFLVQPDEGLGRELWIAPRQPNEGGPERIDLSFEAGFYAPLAVHPDGQRVAFTRAGGVFELWVLENFLPSE